MKDIIRESFVFSLTVGIFISAVALVISFGWISYEAYENIGNILVDMGAGPLSALSLVAATIIVWSFITIMTILFAMGGYYSMKEQWEVVKSSIAFHRLYMKYKSIN